MKDQSIRKLTKIECRVLSKVMGYYPEALDCYEGRYIKIRINSPKWVDSWDGVSIHMNENKGKRTKGGAR
jgi:hypothetical protein